MSLFGQNRDFQLQILMNQELLHNIINQQVGYYKIILEESPSNIYGETIDKKYREPVLLNCLIQRDDLAENTTDFGPDIARVLVVKFIRQDLIDANLFPEIGDIVMWNESFYEVDLKNENQLFVGKNPDYAYSTDTETFGGSLSTILNCHYTRTEIPETKQRNS